MPYIIEVNTEVVDLRDESGEWLDGGHRVIEEMRTEDYEVDPDEIAENGLMDAVAEEIRRSGSGAHVPSVHPIGLQVPERAWLEEEYAHPYTGQVRRTTVYLKGDFTDADRADVFRAMQV